MCATSSPFQVASVEARLAPLLELGEAAALSRRRSRSCRGACAIGLEPIIGLLGFRPNDPLVFGLSLRASNTSRLSLRRRRFRLRLLCLGSFRDGDGRLRLRRWARRLFLRRGCVWRLRRGWRGDRRLRIGLLLSRGRRRLRLLREALRNSQVLNGRSRRLGSGRGLRLVGCGERGSPGPRRGRSRAAQALEARAGSQASRPRPAASAAALPPGRPARAESDQEPPPERSCLPPRRSATAPPRSSADRPPRSVAEPSNSGRPAKDQS